MANIDTILQAHLMKTFDLTPSSYAMLKSLVDGFELSKSCLPNYVNIASPLVGLALKNTGYTKSVGDLPVDIMFAKDTIHIYDYGTGNNYNVECGKEYTVRMLDHSTFKIPRSFGAFSILISHNIFIEQIGPRDKGNRFRFKFYPITPKDISDQDKIDLYCRLKALNRLEECFSKFLDPISMNIRANMDGLELRFETLGYVFHLNVTKIACLGNSVLMDIGSATQQVEYSPYEYPLNSNGHIFLYLNPDNGVAQILYENSYLEENGNDGDDSEQYVLIESNSDMYDAEYENIYVVAPTRDNQVTEFRGRGETLISYSKKAFEEYSAGLASPIAKMVSIHNIKKVGFSELGDPNVFKTKRKFTLRKSFMPIAAWRLTEKSDIDSVDLDDFEKVIAMLN